MPSEADCSSKSDRKHRSIYIWENACVVFSLHTNRRIIEMAVKYPEFNELKKESAFDWLVKSEGESFTKNKAIIRFDMFTQNRKVSISNDMKKAILTLLKKYVDAEQTSYTDVTINVELQKVFDRNSKRKPKTEIYYILCVTVKKMNGETCNLKNTMEIHNVKGSGLLYKSCKIYAYDSLKQFILK